MRSAIAKHLRDFVAILTLVLLALGIGGYILSNQRLYLPKWVPVVGTDFFKLKAEFQTAQSLMPGQGQTVDIAGVPVGEITKVDLENGRAVVTMAIRRKYAPMIRRDATMLLRPKTGLNDMIVALTPGSSAAPRVAEGWTVPVRNTLPNVNLDEILSNLDRDTRDYLKLLLAGLGQGLKGQGRALSAAFRRFEPTARDGLLITKEVAKRRKNLAHVIHNFQLLATELGTKDKELAELIDSSNAVFRSFANQDERLRETLSLLPGTLDATQSALGKADRTALQLGPALASLRPGARALGPSLRASRPFFRRTTPVIKGQLRPFARAAQPTLRVLRPATRELAAITPNLRKTFETINALLNEWAYNPPGKEESFLFWTAWANHIGASIFSTQDAHGPIRRGVVLTSCRVLGVLQGLRTLPGNERLATIIDLLNPPTQARACPGG